MAPELFAESGDSGMIGRKRGLNRWPIIQSDAGRHVMRKHGTSPVDDSRVQVNNPADSRLS